jgi:uncharacterized protein YajQ (UPF0234 family)
MPSFDFVSEVDTVELRNAVDNARRELDTRFDFRGVEKTIELKELTVELTSASDFQVRQMEDLFRTACAKRGVSAAGAKVDDAPEHHGKLFTLRMTFQQGIDQPTAKQIVQLIKGAKLKVQASIQGDKVRVTGKKRDDLQQAIALIQKSELELPIQTENFRD